MIITQKSELLPRRKMSNRWKFAFLFLALFIFRTAFGLSQPFFSPDELQTYLIGLKWYCHGGWPYFGPDLIVTETGFYTQIPGALEALLIGLPLRLCPIPEAPFLFLNLLSLSALAFFSFYLAKRLPEISFYFIFSWLALLPWNLHESTNPINPSYLLFGSLLFTVGLLEAIPGLSSDWIPPGIAFALMGFGLFWAMQFHYSWLLLPPLVLFCFLWRWWQGRLQGISEITGFLAGSAFPLAFLIPTWFKYGLFQEAGGLGTAVAFNMENFMAFFTILARLLSLVTYEMPRFLGENTSLRLGFLTSRPLLLPPGFFLWAVGLVQVPVLLFFGFRKDLSRPQATGISLLTLFAFCLAWGSSWFTSKPPLAHIYYILFPLVAVYSFYVWERLARLRGWRIFGVVCLATNLWFHVGYLAAMMQSRSLYTNRAQVVQAIAEKNEHLLGERRPGSLY